MKQTSMILMSDFYKQSHAEQYPKGITRLISYATARMSRIPADMYGNKLTVFGIQSFIKDFLIERFNETFFNVSLEDAMKEYREVIGETFPIDYVDTGRFEALHKLGYLPIEVGCLAEGTRVPIRSAFELPEGQCQVPFMYIINTHDDFPWVTEFLESVTSSEIWYPMCVANQAYLYRQIVNKWYDKTGCADAAKKSAISEFGFRGGEGSSAATLASAAFLTSFNKTATIPAITYLRNYYNESIKGGNIASGMISTEHSVMCSNKAIDGDEETFLRRLLIEIYPTGAVSVVMDSYDYWNTVTEILGKNLHAEVISRDGTVFVRGDSGDPVDITCETVEKLWDLFGGTLNDSGFKVLDSHVRAIYGDSITPKRANEIYERLAINGFAACNVALGAGSFSTQCAEDNTGNLLPFTRDSYGIAVKATWCQHGTGEEYQLFKNPKTDTGKFKKSQKGLIYVTEENGEIVAYDNYDMETVPKEGNLLQPVFRDGKMINEVTLTDVRNKLHDNKF